MNTLFWMNLCLVVTLTGLVLFRKQSRKIRAVVVIFFLLVQLGLAQRYWIAYRAVCHRPENVMEGQTVYREAWIKGVFAMYEHTRDVYIPYFVIYGIGLAILALNPYRKEDAGPNHTSEDIVANRAESSR